MDKKRLKLIIPVVLVALCVIGYYFFMPAVHFKNDQRVLEKGVEYKAEDFIASHNGEVIPEAERLDTTKVGIYEFSYKVKKFVFEKEFVFIYEVVDTTPPKITIKEKRVTKYPDDPYSDEEIRNNISLDEGRFEYTSNYNSELSGTYKVEIRAVDDYGNESKTSYEVIVLDIEAPLLLFSGDGSMIALREDFDLHDFIAYGDNADPRPVLSYEGEVDTSKLGFYPLHACLQDATGNKTEWDLTIEVVDEFPEYEPDDYEYPFEEFISDYKKEGRSFGLDVSEWQEDIDFEKIKEAGCEFIILRAGFCYDGEFTLDATFLENLKNAKEAGMPVGAYLFSYDNNEEDLLKALDQMFEEIKGETLELPLIFDWEDFAYFNEYEISFQDLNHLYDVFEKYVTEKGYESMLYGSAYYLSRIWTHTDDRPVWLAQYIEEPTYEGKYEIWQVSDKGRIEGIDGPVDLNIWFTNQT